jgi:choline dehydrogenase
MTELRHGYDLIVVGAGTAGCVVAARASEDPARRVLLIEAGPDPQPIPGIISDPRRQSELLGDAAFVRSYPVRRADGSEFPLVSGRLTGGGSSVNNLAVARPMACDFAAWEAIGGERWSYDALLPLMRSIEDDEDFGGSPIHGSGGPLRLHRDFKLGDPIDPPGRALVNSALEMGLPACPDLNGPEPFGICDSPYNVVEGRRQSTAVAYLDPARDRPNLAILPGSLVRRLVIDGGHVGGVELVESGSARVVAADEIVLSAGVFHSPQLLMLSGIGPVDEIVSAGVGVRVPLEGVGGNYQDHAVVYARFQGTGAMRSAFTVPKLRFVVRSAPTQANPDLHVMVHAPRSDSPAGPADLAISIRLLEHRSAGRVALASADPEALPLVEPELLADEDDVRAMLGGMGFVERLTRDPAVAEYYGPMRLPAARSEWRSHVLRTYVSYHHGTGTCRIGRADDPGAVVDPRLRVHGIDNLRVADASVLPTIPHANTNLAAILVGEIAAREITAG